MTGSEALSLLIKGDKVVKRKAWAEGVYLYSIGFEGYRSAILGSHGYNQNIQKEYELVGSLVDVSVGTLDDFTYDDWEVVAGND